MISLKSIKPKKDNRDSIAKEIKRRLCTIRPDIKIIKKYAFPVTELVVIRPALAVLLAKGVKNLSLPVEANAAIMLPMLAAFFCIQFKGASEFLEKLEREGRI